MDSVLSFASSLTAEKGRIKLIKTNHSPVDVDEVEHQIKVLVRDKAKKLQATNNCLRAEQQRIEWMQTSMMFIVSVFCSPRYIRRSND